MVYCHCWPNRALAVALPWYLLLYNWSLSSDKWVTCALNWEVGGLKMSVRVYVWMCDRLLLSLFSACQSSYGHSWFPETRAALPLVSAKFCLAVFFVCASVYSQMIIQMLEFVLLWWHWLSTLVHMNPNVIHFLVQKFVQECSISIECTHSPSQRNVWDSKSGRKLIKQWPCLR